MHAVAERAEGQAPVTGPAVAAMDALTNRLAGALPYSGYPNLDAYGMPATKLTFSESGAGDAVDAYSKVAIHFVEGLRGRMDLEYRSVAVYGVSQGLIRAMRAQGVPLGRRVQDLTFMTRGGSDGIEVSALERVGLTRKREDYRMLIMSHEAFTAVLESGIFDRKLEK